VVGRSSLEAVELVKALREIADPHRDSPEVLLRKATFLLELWPEGADWDLVRPAWLRDGAVGGEQWTPGSAEHASDRFTMTAVRSVWISPGGQSFDFVVTGEIRFEVTTGRRSRAIVREPEVFLSARINLDRQEALRKGAYPPDCIFRKALEAGPESVGDRKLTHLVWCKASYRSYWHRWIGFSEYAFNVDSEYVDHPAGRFETCWQGFYIPSMLDSPVDPDAPSSESPRSFLRGLGGGGSSSMGEGHAFVKANSRLRAEEPGFGGTWTRLVPVAWSSEDLEALGPDTQALDLRTSSTSDADVRKLSSLQSLEALRIGSECRLTDAGLRGIAELPRLRQLSFYPRTLSPEALAALARAKFLTDLDLNFRKDEAGDEMLTSVCRIGTLEHLYVGCCGPVTDAGVRALGALKHLRRLQLSWSSTIIGKGFEALADTPTLETVELTGIQLSPEGALALTRLPALRKLEFYNAALGDQHLRGLAGCLNLRDLQIHRDDRDLEKITDQGVAALMTLKSLERFSITGEEVSEDAVKRLAQAMGGEFLFR